MWRCLKEADEIWWDTALSWGYGFFGTNQLLKVRILSHTKGSKTTHTNTSPHREKKNKTKTCWQRERERVRDVREFPSSMTMTLTWYSKQPYLIGCFSWMIPSLYIKNGCLEFQVLLQANHSFYLVVNLLPYSQSSHFHLQPWLLCDKRKQQLKKMQVRRTSKINQSQSMALQSARGKMHCPNCWPSNGWLLILGI